VEKDSTTVDVARFLAEELQYEAESFDAVLMWDLCDYLPEALVKPVVARIYQITKPRGTLLAFFHTRDAEGSTVLPLPHQERRDAGVQQGPPSSCSASSRTATWENLFHDYTAIKFFLVRRIFGKCCW